MARSLLRVYYGPEPFAVEPPQTQVAQHNVTLPLSEILPLLADAYNNQRTWLRDFEDDEVTLSSDLYEVVLAYQHCRRPSA